MTTLIAAVDYRGWFESGQAGDATTVPGDGGSGATGWAAADGAGGDQAGADYYVYAGKGTGNSPTKGDIIGLTPDIGASGTAVQSLTEKWRCTRLGEFKVQGWAPAITNIDDGDSPYTVSANEHTIICDAASGAITVNLPAVAGVAKRIYNIKKIDSSSTTLSLCTVTGRSGGSYDLYH
jgi:hypothetical protein